MNQLTVFKTFIIGFCVLILTGSSFGQKAGIIEVTLQFVHKNVIDTSQKLKSELGLIVELTNHSNKNVALTISNTNFERELKFYRKNNKGFYELFTHPYISQQEELRRAQEASLRIHHAMSTFVADYNYDSGQGKDFFKYWDTIEQDQFSRIMSDNVTSEEKIHFLEHVSRFQNPLIFCFLRSGDRQTVFWNLEFMMNEKGEYKVGFGPFQFDIKSAPLILKENFEVVDHRFIHANELYIKTY